MKKVLFILLFLGVVFEGYGIEKEFGIFYSNTDLERYVYLYVKDFSNNFVTPCHCYTIPPHGQQYWFYDWWCSGYWRLEWKNCHVEYGEIVGEIGPTTSFKIWVKVWKNKNKNELMKYWDNEFIAESAYIWGISRLGIVPHRIISDFTPPQISLPQSSDGDYYSGWYNADVTINTNNISDNPGGSGLKYKYYKIGNDPNWQNISGNIVINKDGITPVYFQAEDKLGNISHTSINVKIDRERPADVTGINAKLTSGYDPESNEPVISGVLVNWHEVTEDDAHRDENIFVQGCGVAGYDISWKKSDSPGTHTPEYTNLITGTNHFIPINEFQSDRFYDIGIRAVDYLNNPSSAAEGWTSVSIYIPPSPVKIAEVKYEDPPEEYGTVPEYPVNIALDHENYDDNGVKYSWKDYLSKINGIIIKRTFGNDFKQYTFTTNQIIDNNGNLKAPWKEVDGKLTFTDTLIGAQHAHRPYEYKAYTIHTIDNIQEYGNTCIADPVPNYPAKFTIEVKDELGNLIKTIGSEGFEAGTTKATAIFTNQPLYFHLIPHNPDGTDIEGDTLEYNLWTINSLGYNPGTQKSAELGSAWAHKGAPVNFFSQDGLSNVYHCYIGVEEYTSNVTGQEQSLDEIYSNYNPLLTLHGNDEGFFLNFDFKPSAGIFRVMARDKDKEFSVDNPADSTQVRVHIKKGIITDETGFVDSGIEGIYLWNLDTGLIPYVNYLVKEDIANTEPSSASAKTYIGLNLPPGIRAPIEDLNINWDLLPDQGSKIDDYRIVAMKVVDNAGNEHFTWRVLKVDTVPPEAPAIHSFSHSHEAGKIIVTWGKPGSNPDEVLTYRVMHPISPGVPGIIHEVSIPQISVPIAGFGPDEPVSVTVTAVDKAGNESPTVTFTPYTLAELGTLSAHEQGYVAGALGHFFRWGLTGGKAAKHVLELLVYENKSYTVIGSINLEGGFFTHRNLEPHKSYQYRLVAYNSFVPPGGGEGDRTIGDVFTVTLANNPPPAPQNLSPVGFTTPDIRLSWDGVQDADGDALTYHVYMIQQGQTAAQLLGSTSSPECVFPEPGNTWPAGITFTHAHTYTWWIVADDTPGPNHTGPPYTGAQTPSSHVAFTVDAQKPVITVEDLPPDELFTNLQNLPVQVIDSISGAGALSFWTSDGVVPANEPKEIHLTEITPGEYQGNIPLHEETNAYKIYLNATDIAGNEAQIATGEIRCDHTLPEVMNLAINLKQNVQDYLCGSGEVPVEVSLSDNYSGIHGFRYGFVSSHGQAVDTWSFVQIEQNAVPQGSPGEATSQKTLDLKGSDGQKYYLVLQAKDWADNYSESAHSTNPILLDASPPDAQLTIEGFAAEGSGYYVSDLNQLNVSFTYSDNHTGASAWYAVIEDTPQAQPIWHESWKKAQKVKLTAGNTYRILCKAVNGVGLETEQRSEEFVFDDSAPESLSLAWVPEWDLISGEAVRITAQAQDPHSPIVEYRLAIGKGKGSTELSDLINGNVSGWLVTSQSSSSALFSFALPQIADGNYRITLDVRNAADLVTRYSKVKDKLKINNNQDRVLVWDSGPYSSYKSSLKGRWEYKGPKPITGYEYRILGFGGPVPAWVSTQKTEVTADGLQLENGKTYYFEVRALFEGGVYSPAAKSLGVTVDYSAPEFAQVAGLVTPPACASDSLWVSWNATDQESGIHKAEVLLESYDNSNNLYRVSKGWIGLLYTDKGDRVNLNTDAEDKPHNLTTGQKVYLTLRLTNRAGVSVDRAAPVIIIDNTPPPVPLVVDQGDVINMAQYLKAHWIWTKADEESGTAGFKWSVVQSIDQLATATWYDGDGSRTADIEAVIGAGFGKMHGATWYFAVKAINGAGLESIGFSNGITYDETAPFIAAIKLIDAVNLADPGSAQDVHYITSLKNLHLYISAVEELSAITSYEATYGTWDAELNWVPTKGASTYISAKPLIPLDNPVPVLSEGAIAVFRGECINQAGLVSEYGYSRGVVLDLTTPEIINVHGRAVGNDLFFDWDVVPSHSPVIGFSVALMKEGDPSQKQWQEVGLNKSIVINSIKENLADGRYVLYVKAQNASGAYSEKPGKSPTVILDRTPAEITRFTHDPYASRSVRVYIEANDPHSGITEYQYTLGTFEAPEAVTGSWISVFSNAGILDETILFDDYPAGTKGIQDGTQLFLRVRARNGAGFLTPDMVSDPILIDKTPASSPVVSCGKYTIYHFKVEGINFSSSDQESGITHYRAAVVAGKDAASLQTAQWFEKQVSTPGKKLTALNIENLTLDGLALEHGVMYYAAVQTRNGSGDWSEPGFSELVYADLTPPALTFTHSNIEIVVNDLPYDIEYTLIEDVSEWVDVTFTLIHPDGMVQTFAPMRKSPGTYVFSFEESTHGRYELKASLTDAAGNWAETADNQRIRVNFPPEITLHDFLTTPGKPLELSAFVYDPDGDVPFTYRWDFGDGSKVSYAERPVHPFYHKNMFDQVTTYTITLTVTDSAGKSSTETAQVIIENTSKGQLYVDEYWSATHTIKGDIVVPSGITLTILPATEIVITGNPLEGYDHRLTIQGSLSVTAGASFHMDYGLNELWNGIFVEGNAELNGIIVQDAKRGLTVVGGASAMVKDSIFRSNQIGIHVHGVNQEISNCSFLNNDRYGIKEDAGARPLVRNCIFLDNLYDYYHEQLTVITGNKLNDIGGNSGNISDKEE